MTAEVTIEGLGCYAMKLSTWSVLRKKSLQNRPLALYLFSSRPRHKKSYVDPPPGKVGNLVLQEK